jgi:hypothetical protein
MHLHLQTVRRVFEDVLSGAMSRGQADRWAYAVVQEEETGVVTYSPPHERERIWAGVMYLYGVDTMKAPGEYLHSDGDIRAAMNAKLSEVSGGGAAVPLLATTGGHRSAKDSGIIRLHEQLQRPAVLDLNLPG